MVGFNTCSNNITITAGPKYSYTLQTVAPSLDGASRRVVRAGGGQQPVQGPAGGVQTVPDVRPHSVQREVPGGFLEFLQSLVWPSSGLCCVRRCGNLCPSTFPPPTSWTFCETSLCSETRN